MSGWEQVGGDPSPGDVDAIRGAASQLTSLATQIADLEARMRDAATGMVDLRWMGPGADAMNAAVGRDLPGLTTMQSSYARAANALQRHAGRLEELQQRARSELAKHDAAVRDARAARSLAAEADARRTAAVARADQLEHDVHRLEAERGSALAGGQPTASIDARLASQRAALAAQRSQQDDAGSDAASAGASAEAADDRAGAARRAIEEIRDEAEQLAGSTRTAILGAAGLVSSNNPLVDILNGAGAGLLGIFNGARDAWDKIEGGLPALEVLILRFGVRIRARDALGRWLSPATLTRLERQLAMFDEGGYFFKNGVWKTLGGVSKKLGMIGLGASAVNYVDGLLTNDRWKQLDGGIGLGTGGAALVAGGLAGTAIGVAGGAALLYGEATLPTSQQEIDGTYDFVMRQQFGAGYDPENPTTEQAAWGLQRYSGFWGPFNFISDGMNYTAYENMKAIGGWFD